MLRTEQADQPDSRFLQAIDGVPKISIHRRVIAAQPDAGARETARIIQKNFKPTPHAFTSMQEG